MHWKKELGIQIKEARRDAFRRQEDLSREVEIHTNMVGRYERGEAAPELDVLVLIADALNCAEFTIGEHRISIYKINAVEAAQPSSPQQMRLAYGKEYLFEGEDTVVKIQPQKEGLWIVSEGKKTSA